MTSWHGGEKQLTKLTRRFGTELIGKEMGIKQALLYDSILFDRNWLTLNAHVQWMIKADSIKL